MHVSANWTMLMPCFWSDLAGKTVNSRGRQHQPSPLSRITRLKHNCLVPMSSEAGGGAVALDWLFTYPRMCSRQCTQYDFVPHNISSCRYNMEAEAVEMPRYFFFFFSQYNYRVHLVRCLEVGELVQQRSWRSWLFPAPLPGALAKAARQTGLP
jgi:hypothetical protein